MKDLIRKILKESEDEFDWVDVNPSLYDLINNLFKHEHPEYWLEKTSDDTGTTVPMEFLDNSDEEYYIYIVDETGHYFALKNDEFTVENIRKRLYNDLVHLNVVGRELGDNTLKNDYIKLAKALEPIIGPIPINERY